LKLIRYFKSILNVSLLELDEEKNLAILLSQNPLLLFKLFCAIETTIAFAFTRNSPISLDHISPLVVGIRYLMGLGAPYRLSYPPSLRSAFIRIRDQCLTRSQYFDRRDRHLFHLFATLLNKQSLSLHFSPLMNENDDDYKGVISSLVSLQRPSPQCLGDQLCLLSLEVCSLDQEMEIERKRTLFRELFAIPALTYLISVSCLQTHLATVDTLTTLLTMFNTTHQLVLPPSPISMFKSGQWLVGNLTSLCCYLPLDHNVSSDDNREMVHDQLLIDYLHLLTSLFIKYDVPNVWQGKRGVVWTRDGTTLVAAAIPKALQYQLLSFTDGKNMKRLYGRCLAPLGNSLPSPPLTGNSTKRSSSIAPAEAQNIYPRKKDSAEVQDALSSSGLKMVRASLVEQTEAANSWMGSKWASKMIKSVSKAWNLFGSNEQTPSRSDVTEAINSSISEAEGEPQEISPFLPNDQLAGALCRVWSIILPQAASSPPESICWKGLSVLCFSTKAVNKLWALAVRSSTATSSLFSSTDDQPLLLSFPSIPTEGMSMSRDLVPGLSNGLEVLVSMTAILKIICIALDDSELYDRGVSEPSSPSSI
jgi:hypothetical protein